MSSKIVMGSTGKSICCDLWISGKVIERQNTSKMILGGPSCTKTDPWWSTVPPKIKLKTIEIQKSEK